MEHETLSREQVLEIFAPVHERPTRGSYTGYGKRLPSDRPPVLTPKELALTAASDGKELSSGNGQGPSHLRRRAGAGLAAGPMRDPLGSDPFGPADQRGSDPGRDAGTDTGGQDGTGGAARGDPFEPGG